MTKDFHSIRRISRPCHNVEQTKGTESSDCIERNDSEMIPASQGGNVILLKMNSYLRSLIDSSVHGIITVDPHMRIQHFNTVFCQFWNLPEDMIYIGGDVTKILRYCADQTSNPELFMYNSRTVVSSPDVFWNNRINLLDGRFFRVSSSPIRGSDETFYGWIWEVFDITEHVQMEEKLIAAQSDVEEKNSLLSTLLEASSHATLSVDSRWCIRYYNKNFCEMWGLSEDIIHIGADGIELLKSYCAPKMFDPDHFSSIIEMLSDNHDLYFDGRIYMADGKIFQTLSSPILGLDGVYYGRTLEMTDITDYLLREQQLELAFTELIYKDQQLTSALESAGEGLWTWESSTQIFTLNPEFASRYRSISESQSIDSLISAIHPEDRKQLLIFFSEHMKNYDVQLMDSLLSGISPDDQEQFLKISSETAEKSPGADAVIELEFRLQSNEGMWRWIMSRGIVTEVVDDAVITSTGTFVDITDRKMYEKHLSDKNRKMLMLSQITRHDIMNQLTNAFSLSTLIYDDTSDPYIKNLLELLDQHLKTMQHQMGFSKDYDEFGVHGAAWQDVNACIQKGKNFLIHPPVELLADDIPMIYADPLLEKVIYNLIENSIRHGVCVTQIGITFLAEENHSGILTFRDNGIGIPDEDKEKIFDRNFGKNTGLGLFLVREIFGLTDITIRECGTFGQGVQFEITIPSDYWKWQ